MLNSRHERRRLPRWSRQSITAIGITRGAQQYTVVLSGKPLLSHYYILILSHLTCTSLGVVKRRVERLPLPSSSYRENTPYVALY